MGFFFFFYMLIIEKEINSLVTGVEIKREITKFHSLHSIHITLLAITLELLLIFTIIIDKLIDRPTAAQCSATHNRNS